MPASHSLPGKQPVEAPAGSHSSSSAGSTIPLPQCGASVVVVEVVVLVDATCVVVVALVVVVVRVLVVVVRVVVVVVEQLSKSKTQSSSQETTAPGRDPGGHGKSTSSPSQSSPGSTMPLPHSGGSRVVLVVLVLDVGPPLVVVRIVVVVLGSGRQ